MEHTPGAEFVQFPLKRLVPRHQKRLEEQSNLQEVGTARELALKLHCRFKEKCGLN